MDRKIVTEIPANPILWHRHSPPMSFHLLLKNERTHYFREQISTQCRHQDFLLTWSENWFHQNLSAQSFEPEPLRQNFLLSTLIMLTAAKILFSWLASPFHLKFGVFQLAVYFCNPWIHEECICIPQFSWIAYRNYVPATSQHIYPEPDNSGGSSWYIGNTFFLYSPNIANITYAHKLSTYIGSFYPYIITSKKRFVLFCHSGLFFVPIGKTPTEKALTRCVGLKVPNRLTVISAPSEKIFFNLISYDGNRYLWYS